MIWLTNLRSGIQSQSVELHAESLEVWFKAELGPRSRVGLSGLDNLEMDLFVNSAHRLVATLEPRGSQDEGEA
jgi:hypothetical protein